MFMRASDIMGEEGERPRGSAGASGGRPGTGGYSSGGTPGASPAGRHNYGFGGNRPVTSATAGGYGRHDGAWVCMGGGVCHLVRQGVLWQRVRVLTVSVRVRRAETDPPSGRPNTTGGALEGNLGLAGALPSTTDRRSMLQKQAELQRKRRAARRTGGFMATSRPTIDGPDAPRRWVHARVWVAAKGGVHVPRFCGAAASLSFRVSRSLPHVHAFRCTCTHIV